MDSGPPLGLGLRLTVRNHACLLEVACYKAVCIINGRDDASGFVLLSLVSSEGWIQGAYIPDFTLAKLGLYRVLRVLASNAAWVLGVRRLRDKAQPSFRGKRRFLVNKRLRLRTWAPVDLGIGFFNLVFPQPLQSHEYLSCGLDVRTRKRLVPVDSEVPPDPSLLLFNLLHIHHILHLIVNVLELKLEP